jgi:hypothetical protein
LKTWWLRLVLVSKAVRFKYRKIEVGSLVSCA